MALKDITTQNLGPAPKKSLTCEKRLIKGWKILKIVYEQHLEVWQSHQKSQHKAKEFNIGSNKVFFEMNEDTT